MDKIKNGAEEIYLVPETESSDELVLDEPIKETKNEDVPVLVEAEPEKNVRVSEILELREGNRKVYRMSDGTEQAVFYPETVHVFDEDTKTFDDVDNTLVEEEDGRHFVSGKNHFKARFSREEENDELFSIESGMCRVTVSAGKNKKHKNQGVKPRVRKKDTEGFERTDVLVFDGVQDGAEYEYSVTGNGVKENIVVKEKADVYRYPFVLHMENVTAQFDEENKRVAFISNETGEEVFFIPAPYMTDKNGVISTAVSYEVKNTANGDMIFNVVADSEWMNSDACTFPVIIDPQVQVSGNSAMNTYSWHNGSLYSAPLHTVGTTGCGDGACNAKRMYMSFSMPTLPRNPRIKKAELKFFQASSSDTCCNYPKLGLYRVTENICLGNCTPHHNSDLIDFATMQIDHCEDGEVVNYTFDVTTLVDQVNKGEVGVKNLVLKMIDEIQKSDNNITLYGSANSGIYAPQFIITYESSYGVNTSYRTHTHELGRFGQGSIDLQCGNLMFESEDFAWAGNRMPVTIKHLYNSALYAYQYTANSGIKLSTADFSAMKLGYGYKLNIMQSMMDTTFQHEGESYIGYVYIGENGEETFFKESDKRVQCNSKSQCYNLYEDVNGGDMLYDPVKLTLKQGEETYQFDSMGRLIQIKDAAGNHMDITYTSNRITSVTDGAGRDFSFAYNSSGFLTSITAPDETRILYTYSGNLLNTITYQDGKKAVFTYSSYRPTAVTLLDAKGNNVYKVAYSYSGDRLATVTEYGVQNGAFVQGAKTTYSYSVASGRTIVQTYELMDDAQYTDCYETAVKTVYTFDDDGNIVSEYAYSEDTGNTGVEGEESGINPHSGAGGAGVVSNINNLLKGHNFSNSNDWCRMPCNCGDLYIQFGNHESSAKFGKNFLYMQSYTSSCTEKGVYQVTNTLPAGQYTFSTYVRVATTFSGTQDKGVYIRVTTTNGTVLAESERIVENDNEYIRLTASFALESSQSVQVQLLVCGRGAVYFNAPQLENNPYANAYNMLENGNFESSKGWNTSGAYYSPYTRFNMSGSMYIWGNIELTRCAYQRVYVKTNRFIRETFTLSGWAKGYGLPTHKDGVKPTFRLRAKIKYYDSYYREYGTEEYTADFSPCTEEWQLASVQFAKSKYRMVEYIDIYLDYDHNYGAAYFDDIQLVRNSIETDLSAEDFETEPQEQASENTVNEAESENAAENGFKELTDIYGNTLTETTFTDGEFGTIYRAFQFNADTNDINGDDAGNDLISETDARGNVTEYTVDGDTSRNEEVIDRCGNKTAYEYDKSGRTTKVTSLKPRRDVDENVVVDKNGNVLYEEITNVSYAYDSFDNLTEIVRGDGLKYALKYNAFHNLESIGIHGKTDGDLIQYTYKAGNGRLKEIAYANGDKMTATYNSIGQMIAEKWYNASNELTAHYKYVYDGQGNIVRSIDLKGKKVYNYLYEEGKMMRSSEADVELDANEIITSKTLVCTVRYYYDAKDTLVKKRTNFADGKEHTVLYEQAENDAQIVRFTAGGKTVTSHSKTDSFGRKVFDELQLGTGFVSRQFHYHAGEVTDEHAQNDMLKSSPTTQLVSQIVLSGGRTISYEYDEEERITKVTDSLEGVTEYTYDALGQLLTETKNGETVNRMFYDNYGNILQKNGVQYVYDDVWEDKLIFYDGQPIIYDAQGNPTEYLGHNLTWEKGRQLKSFDNIQYTYNANGIRTSKTIAGNKHTYILDGAKILKEVWDNGDEILETLYDNEDNVCGVIYNETPYFFQKNLQGDIIAITDSTGKEVARYSYDAWGVCTIIKDVSACAIASINPFRYRSYFFDKETGMYYLQSRYYDPTVGRFVNADEVIMPTITNDIVLGLNLSSYVFNDPINQKDSIGFIAHAIIGAITGALISALSYFVEYWLGMRNLNWWAFAGIVATAAALGAIGGYISGWAKFAKLAKHARLPRMFEKLKSPIVRNIVTWAVRGIKFVINSFVKKLSRKPGESWVKAIRRWLNI